MTDLEDRLREGFTSTLADLPTTPPHPSVIRRRAGHRALPPGAAGSPRVRRPALIALAAAGATAAAVVAPSVLTVGGSPAGVAAASVLTRAADSAGAAAAAPRPEAGQFLYLRDVGSQEDENGPGGRCGVVYERWISADGTAPGRIVRHDGVRPPSRTWNGDTAGLTKEKDCYQGVVDEVSEKPAPGGSWTEPTRGFVAGLPTDPRALYERAAADIARDGQQLTKEQGIFNYFSDLLLSGSPHLTPALKSAVYRAMALVPGVRDLGTATDLLGRQGVAVAGPEDGDDRTILDPATGELLGESGGYEVARTYAVVNDTASRP